jgi:hypothetical protein
MSSKKIIVGIIFTMILFVFFMRYTLISLQKETVDLVTYEYEAVSDRLEEGIQILGKDKFLERFQIDGNPILLIDHIEKDAIIWSKESIRSIKYADIPQNMKKANSFFLEINDENTVLINTDEILGDLEERMIGESYKYLRLKQDKLDPYEVDYFPSINENVELRYFRNMIIDELIIANKENTGLERAKCFFDKWEEYDADDFNYVAHYDIYEGYQEYIKLEVKEKNNNDFDIYSYLESKRNEFGFFNKEDEYKIIGLLLIQYSFNNDIDLIRENQADNNIYKNLLYKTPSITYEEYESYEEFKVKHEKWMQSLPEIIYSGFDEFENTHDVEFSHENIVTEKYDYTFKINSNYYLYINYCARFNDNSVIEKDHIIVRVSPNLIEYYYEFN